MHPNCPLHGPRSCQKFEKKVALTVEAQNSATVGFSPFTLTDAPVAPSYKGMDHFLYGLSDEMKQAHREQLFTISHKKLLAMSDRYLGTGKSTHGLAILRPENPKIAKDPSWIIRPCGSVLLTDGSSTGRPDGSSPEKQVGWGGGPTRAAGPSRQHPCLLWQESSENSKLGPSKDRGLDWTRNWLSDFSNPHLGGFNMQLGLQSRGRVDK
ncbi:uncharacterized protein [Chlorocebus sabaeus]|uniref:uncharacterized protein isoform X6 n=1 Tax=Chlorocebus sabaeus TaxID=60711 RepID=UPI003BF9A796